MTTTVHIVNLGPQLIEVKTGQNPKQTLSAKQSVNVDVYKGQVILVEEVPYAPERVEGTLD